ncbi:MAG: sulfatase [Planctomycetota bacterium]|nr:sulfatase [Planctomycetota bacterium]
MSRGSRFARRLACAVAIFELAAGFGTGSVVGGSVWQTIFVICAPLAIYGVLLPLGSRVFEHRAARASGNVAYLLIAALYFGRHHFGPATLDAAITLGALLIGGVALLAPPLRLDAWLRWLLPATALPAAVALALWIRAEGEVWRDLPPTAAAAPGAPNLVLVSWDTVRADVLSPYSGSGVDTPHLLRLVAEGYLFDDAVALASITGPSHASMLTGRYPPMHGVRSNGAQGIAASVPTLPEMLKDVGYHTGGFVSAYPMLGKFGFARGFEVYDDRLPASGAVLLTKLGRRNFLWLQLAGKLLPNAPDASVAGEVVNRRAFEWLDALEADGDGRPFLLFAHYYDAHGPFKPAEPWRAAALAAEASAFPRAADASVQDEMTLYRAEIAQVDALFGELRARLEQADPGLQNTLILLTSDHGECFGEGGIVLNHTASLYEATQHVPMVLRLPAAVGAGTRILATATHLDIVPTFLAAAGAAPSPEFGGPGLQLTELDALRPPGSQRRQVYMEAQQLHLGDERKIGWRSGKRKLVRWQNGAEQLWGFGPDEPEGLDLGATEAATFTRLRLALEEFLGRMEPALGEFVELGAEDAASLGALGYAED